MRTREQIVEEILDCGVIAIIRLQDGEQLCETAKAVYAGGIRVIEFTLNTPGVSFLEFDLGGSLAALGDLNSDGYHDFAIGRSTVDATNRDNLLIFLGAADPDLHPDIVVRQPTGLPAGVSQPRWTS